MVATASDSRLRQIAILVASIDTASARQLLLHLPTDLARRVRAMAAEVGTVSPEERRALLAELQRSGLKPPATNVTGNLPVPGLAVAADSRSSAAEAREAWPGLSGGGTIQPTFSTDESTGPAWKRLSVAALLRCIRHERPTIIAVVLQQLPAHQAAAVLQQLPAPLGREVLRCLGTIQEIDPDAMQAIDEHLSQRLSEYHHRFESELESSRRIRELLAAAPTELRRQWAQWLQPDEAAHASQPLQPAKPQPSAAPPSLDTIYRSASITTNDTHWTGSAQTLATDDRPTPSQIAADVSGGHPAPWAADDSPAVTASDQPSILPFRPRSQTASDGASTHGTAAQQHPGRTPANFERILTLSAHELAVLLSSLDARTILLSLAGASPPFMKRFSARLEPADARLLQQRLQKIGPLNLRDVDEAQRRVLEAYELLKNPPRVRTAA